MSEPQLQAVSPAIESTRSRMPELSVEILEAFVRRSWKLGLLCALLGIFGGLMAHRYLPRPYTTNSVMRIAGVRSRIEGY